MKYNRNVQNRVKFLLKVVLHIYQTKRQVILQKTTMKAIRAAIERFLKKKLNKGFSIVGDPTFTEANAVLDAFVKDL